MNNPEVNTPEDPAADVVVRGTAGGFLQKIRSGTHEFQADEPVSVGGSDTAPTPYDYLLAGLGACTSMTVGLFARRKKWPLEDVAVSLRHSRIHAKDCADCETTEGMLDRIEMDVELTGPLTPEQHAKLMEIAHKCPVHRTIKSEIDIKVRPKNGAKVS
ncbi:MAG: OsmC family protein [Chthoniobacterales bacterium]|nr:OsmC family protein [Chthoniobacterales bacterium]